jgi:beta-glucosidase
MSRERPVRLARLVWIIWAAALLSLPLSAQRLPPYKNAALSTDARVADLLGRMTLVEKFWQLYMSPGDLDDPAHDYSNGVFGLQIRTKAETATAHAERVNAIQRYFVERTRLGIPIIPFEEALHGLSMPDAIVYPQAIALAATWDVALAGRVARAVAADARGRGIRQVLSPVVNIADDVRWGRVEETYGEDAYLASAMGAAFVAAFEEAGVVATPKHFVANVGDGGRDSYPIHHSERLLFERYLPPFEAAIRAGARSVMTAYNSVDGQPATQNARLLNGILKGQWGFEGFVISDAAATGGATVLHMTEESTPHAAAHALESGLDVIFQSSWPQHRPYLQAFTSGLVPAAVVDRAVARVLRVKFELGLFEDPYVDVEAARASASRPADRALAREAAARAIVLLKNDAGLLPLDPTLRRVAVVGADADEARLGGYSGPGVAPVSILSGLREAMAQGGAALTYVPGPGRSVPGLVVVPEAQLATGAGAAREPGLRGEYFANPTLAGAPALVRVDRRPDFRWTLNSPGRGIPFDWYSARWTGRITAPAGGVGRIGVEGNDGYRLFINDALVIDNWRKVSYGSRTAQVSWPAGASHDLRLEFFETTGNARLRLVWDAGVVDQTRAAIDEAVRAARASDVAVVVAGIEEGEFRDRAFLGLPGLQDRLIRDVAATGTPVVVVLVGGSAITMPWIDAVGAIVDAWYPGEEGGRAVADVLFGRENPAGRLPVTFPMADGQLPLAYDHKPTGRGDDYLDLTGMPLFPFGFGLSYTTFAYRDLHVTPDTIGRSGTVTVGATVTNTGRRAGDEVVQLYVRDLLATVARPVMSLRRFLRVHLEPGASREILFTLGPADLTLLDRDLRPVVEPGRFRVLVGASSEDIRLRGEFVVK